jgi:antitoxin ChpS
MAVHKAVRKPASKAAPRVKRAALARVDLASVGPAPGRGFLDNVRLKKSGGSLVMTVPAAARKLLGLSEGQDMAISVQGGKVIAEPMAARPAARARRPKYTLDELLAGYPADSDRTGHGWMEAAPAGRETW